MKKLVLLFLVAFNANVVSAQWQQINCPSGTGDGIMNIATNGNYVYASIDELGVYVSPNNGNTWTAANSGVSASYYTCLAISGSDIFLGTDAGIFRSYNNGNNWAPVNTGLTTTFVSSMAANGSKIYAGTGLGHLFYTSNSGTSWTEISNGLPCDLSISSMIFGLAFDNSTIYVGSGEGVYRSLDYGQNWVISSTGIVDFNVVGALLVSGNNILAGTDNGLYISSDNGNNWSPLNFGFSYVSVNSFVKDGSTLYMGTSNGVFKSTNDGLLWESNNTGFTNHNIQQIVINGNYMFANENTTDIWRRPLSELQGIGDNDASVVPVLFPNPTNGKFTINSLYGINSVEVFNTLGEQVYLISDCDQQTQMEIDISDVPKGIYFVKILDKKNTNTVKIVLQ